MGVQDCTHVRARDLRNYLLPDLYSCMSVGRYRTHVDVPIHLVLRLLSLTARSTSIRGGRRKMYNNQ